ncbi:MAG: hypothetical protein EOO61_11535 [Hymenobacter sp.]|nr:MAG: hypothetical protein EOO61_11535 [Hymenobacter sp.]
MLPPTPTESEYCIHFQAFLTSAELSGFLLNNRLAWVKGQFPHLTQVRVIVEGSTTAKPHHITTLACLLEEYRQEGIMISFEDSGSVVYPYLEEIGFFARWQPGYSFDMESLLLPVDSRPFVLWQIQRETSDAYIQSAYQHYVSHFFHGKDLSFLATHLAELFNNVLDHAFAGEATERIAFAFLQYYPSRGRLFVSVSDFGMGIPASVNRFLRSQGKEPIIPAEAVRWALKLHYTAKSKPHNRGWGLHTVSTGIELLRGQLVIQTSRVVYAVVQSGKQRLSRLPETPFPGTTVSMTMFYDELPDEEASIMDEEASLF